LNSLIDTAVAVAHKSCSRQYVAYCRTFSFHCCFWRVLAMHDGSRICVRRGLLCWCRR